MPVSAQECAASATIDAEPVIIAATDFAAAIRKFAPNATSTVSVLSVSVDEPIGTIASGAPPGRGPTTPAADPPDAAQPAWGMVALGRPAKEAA